MNEDITGKLERSLHTISATKENSEMLKMINENHNTRILN
jgi:hypothetical protein